MVMTTFNEARNIGALIHDVLAQTRRPDELIVVDGGSTDGTVSVIHEALEGFELEHDVVRVISVPGANVPEGRNIGIREAKYECICVTDAGCRLEKDWCEHITAPILDGGAGMVGGFYFPVARTRFQRVLAAVTTAKKPRRAFLPSSRSIAFTKTLWESVGGYPEWLRWGEDTLFNELCVATGAPYVVAPEAVVHWEVRPDLRATTKQFFNYARGDGIRFRRSWAYTADVLLTAATAALLMSGRIWGVLLIVLYACAISARHATQLSLRDLPLVVGLAVVIRVVRACGYVRGLFEGRFGRRAGRP